MLNKNEVKMVNEMLGMQEKLDEAFLKYAEDKPDDYQRYLAWLDELGEFLHEDKKSWCWWKKKQHEVDRQRLLEELVDMFHFALGIRISCTPLRSNKKMTSRELMICSDHAGVFADYPSKAVRHVYSHADSWEPICATIIIMYAYGFHMSDVYQEYLNKNKENYERIRGGY